MTNPHGLLTLEQQELYDGVLSECQQNGEKAVTVLDRYNRLIEEQVRDVAAVRKVLCGSGTAKASAQETEGRQ